MLHEVNRDRSQPRSSASTTDHGAHVSMCRSRNDVTDGVRLEARSHNNHSAVIARFEDFLAVNYDRDLYLADICTAIGASERTLRICCHEHIGMGPCRYIWLRRMHLAHRALVLASPFTTTVTEIATDHGFGELGRFATEYRALFGESPSESLRRPTKGQQPNNARKNGPTHTVAAL